MIRLKRHNTIWLAAMALITGIGIVAAGQVLAAPLAIQFILLAIFGISALASLVELGRERETLMSALKRAPIRNRVSPQAREAGERARARGGFVNNNMALLDVGLIAVQSSYEGMAMRRTRNISKDDDGVRPFVTLNVSETEAERNAVVRYEIYNQYGEQKFIHEMRVFLRQGEMNIMTDHHLPLAGNRDITGAGDWDLKIFIDGNLVALHNFMLAPSISERQRRLAGEEEIAVDERNFQIVDEVKQESAPRIQDLLQQDDAAPDQSADRSDGPTRRSRTRRRRR